MSLTVARSECVRGVLTHANFKLFLDKTA